MKTACRACVSADTRCPKRKKADTRTVGGAPMHSKPLNPRKPHAPVEALPCKQTTIPFALCGALACCVWPCWASSECVEVCNRLSCLALACRGLAIGRRVMQGCWKRETPQNKCIRLRRDRRKTSAIALAPALPARAITCRHKSEPPAPKTKRSRARIGVVTA